MAGAALLALAACSRESLVEDSGTEILHAEIVDEASTRTTYDGTTGKFAWETGDEIALLIKKEDTDTYRSQVDKVTPTSTDRTGTFVYSKEAGYTRTAYAVYPASVYPSTSAKAYDGTLLLTLPDSYVASESTPLPMVADNSEGEKSNLAFKPACGLLRIQCSGLTGGEVIVTMNQGVTGNFALNTSGPVPQIDVVAATETNKTVTFGITGATATLNLPLPCGEYNGITVSNGSVTKSIPAVFTMKRGYGKRMQVNFSE